MPISILEFRIVPADTFIWNLSELVDFLIAHQNQHIVILTGEEGCCARTIGLYDWIDKFQFASVTIKTSNILEKHQSYNIKHGSIWKYFETNREISNSLHQWNNSAVFGTIYGRPLWHRLGIVSYLLNNYKKISCVGCASDPIDIDKRKLFELTQLYQYSPASLVDFAQIQNQLPVYHTDIANYSPGHIWSDGFTIQTERVYVNFLIDIVAETFTSGYTFFATEKTIRPMLLKKPMIVMASKNHLDYLHQLGFKTFSNFWSEEYDAFDQQVRYSKILELIDNLSKKTNQELQDMYMSMQDILDHNYNLLMSQSYKKSIIEIL